MSDIDLTTETTSITRDGTTSGCADFDLALKFLADHREDEALDHFELAIASADDLLVRTSAAAHVAALLLGFARPWEVAAFTEQVRPFDQALANYLDSAVCSQFNDPLGALAFLGDRGVPQPSVDRWFPWSIAAVRAVRARALAAAGRLGDAAYELDIAFSENSESSELWESVARIGADPDIDFDVSPYVARLPERLLPQVFGWLNGSPLAGVDIIAEACWLRFGATHALLAAVSWFAPKVDTKRSLDWTVRISQAGGSACPVLDRSETAGVAPADRVRAGAAGALIDEARGRSAVESAALLLSDDQVEALTTELIALAPEVVDSFVVAAATTTVRSLAIATVLCDHDYAEYALAVLVHGLGLRGADDLNNEQFDILGPLPVRVSLAAKAEAAGDLEVATMLRSVHARKAS